MTDIATVHAIHTNLSKQEIFLYYSGYISEDVLLGVGKMLRKKLELVHTERAISRNIFSIFVEEVQNIIRYSHHVLSATPAENQDNLPLDELRHGLVLIGKSDDQYFICCGNLVLNADADRLEKSLTEIQASDADALKSKYKKAIRNPPPEGSKGAGLGLIDIARKASGGVSFEFMPFDDRHKYFYLTAHA